MSRFSFNSPQRFIIGNLAACQSFSTPLRGIAWFTIPALYATQVCMGETATIAGYFP